MSAVREVPDEVASVARGDVPRSAGPAIRIAAGPAQPPARSVRSVGAAARAAATRAVGTIGTGPTAWLLPLIGVQVAAATIGAPVGATLDAWQAIVALALILGGGWAMRSAARELEVHATPVCPDEAARALVVTGPYRIGRHPMYLGAVSVLAGTAAALGSVEAAVVAAGYALWIDRRFARAEDARLEARFGGAWRAWAARTRRWV